MITKLFQNLSLARSAILNNKFRSILTVLGITIGIATVVLLVSVGQAVEGFILNQFSGLGTDLIVIFGARDTSVNPNASGQDAPLIPLTQSDLEALSDPLRLPLARTVTPILGVDDPVTNDGNRYNLDPIGVADDYLEVATVEIGLGRTFTQEEYDNGARVAIIGTTAAEKLFDNQYPIGREFRIGGIPIRVVGVLRDQGGNFFNDPSEQVLLPINTIYTRFDSGRLLSGDRPVTGIFIRAINDDVVPEMMNEVTLILREQHELEFGEEDDFIVRSSQTLLSTLRTITGLLTVFLGFVASISLLVGGIGIMNIMLVTVTERTKEIGLRKAVGAQRFDILVQFITEAVILSLFGGGIGTLLAVGGTTLATTLISDLSVSVDVSSIVLASVISLIIGAAFGAYPANRAANMSPIDALRYE